MLCARLTLCISRVGLCTQVYIDTLRNTTCSWYASIQVHTFLRLQPLLISCPTADSHCTHLVILCVGGLGAGPQGASLPYWKNKVEYILYVHVCLCSHRPLYACRAYIGYNMANRGQNDWQVVQLYRAQSTSHQSPPTTRHNVPHCRQWALTSLGAWGWPPAWAYSIVYRLCFVLSCGCLLCPLHSLNTEWGPGG